MRVDAWNQCTTTSDDASVSLMTSPPLSENPKGDVFPFEGELSKRECRHASEPAGGCISECIES